MYLLGAIPEGVEVAVFPIDLLLEKAKYLIEIEDRIPPGFFIDRRLIFEKAIQFFLGLKKWKAEGVTNVQMIYEANTPRSIHDPFREYYIWIERLHSLKTIIPLK